MGELAKVFVAEILVARRHRQVGEEQPGEHVGDPAHLPRRASLRIAAAHATELPFVWGIWSPAPGIRRSNWVNDIDSDIRAAWGNQVLNFR